MIATEHWNRLPKFVLVQFLLIGIIPFQSTYGQETDSLIVNGNFAQWSDGVPQGWSVEIGAHNGGDSPVSKIERVDGPALRLSGSLETLAWNALRQNVKIEPEQTYQLRFTARVEGLRREGNQYDNCFVSAILKNASGQKIAQQVVSIQNDVFLPMSIYCRAPGTAASADVLIFLSKSGALTVKDIDIRQVAADRSFEILVDQMNRHYSFFDIKEIDWQGLVDRYQERAEAAKTKTAFIDVVADMLAELKDVHIWINDGQRQVSKFQSSFTPNFDFSIVEADLQQKQAIGQLGIVGRSSDGLGYIRISKLNGIDQPTLAQMIAAIESLFDAPGIIVDLRANIGGAEPVAASIASLFADRQYEYARQKYRNGPNHNEFAETTPRSILPRPGKTYTKPIVCLTGPGAVSSGEGMALMFKSFPHCTLVGKPTRGASGNPAAIQLPNGVDVYFSRWVSMEPDGTSIEGRGVIPDVEVEHQQGSDATYQKAKEILNERSRS